MPFKTIIPTGRDARSVGQRLALVRGVLGLSSGVFALQAGIGLSAYSQYEGGRRRCSIESAIALVDTYQLSLDWIFLGQTFGLQPKLVEALGRLLELRSTSSVA
jgi:transcriptional regulator with XRE-family HTH domain